MDKWDKLKSLIEANSSHPDLLRVKEWMDDLDKEERKEMNSFYFSDVPSFDRAAWERMLEERGIQGLS